MTDTDTLSMIAESLRGLAVPIDEPQTHPENPRMGDVDAIAESLRRFGQVRPIVLQESTRYVVAGNHTLKAARQLGWTHIAAASVDLSANDAIAYLLADNRLADRGTYDNEVLRELLARASGNLAGTGFDEDDALAMMDGMPEVHPTEMVRVEYLAEHEANYREHPPEQVEHLTRSLKEHGFYRNVVVANDGTVLAGHGLLAAAREMGLRKVPVTRLPCGPDDPEALRVIAGDNEIGKLAARDDRGLTELLKHVAETGDVGELLGSGFDAQTLANLVFVSRPESEVADFNAAAEWVGMPDFTPMADRISLILAFDSEEERDRLVEQLGLIIAKKTRKTWSAWWPPREQEDLSSLRFERGDDPAIGEGAPADCDGSASCPAAVHAEGCFSHPGERIDAPDPTPEATPEGAAGAPVAADPSGTPPATYEAPDGRGSPPDEDGPVEVERGYSAPSERAPATSRAEQAERLRVDGEARLVAAGWAQDGEGHWAPGGGGGGMTLSAALVALAGMDPEPALPIEGGGIPSGLDPA